MTCSIDAAKRAAINLIRDLVVTEVSANIRAFIRHSNVPQRTTPLLSPVSHIPLSFFSCFRVLKPQLYPDCLTVTAHGKGGMAIGTMILDVSHIISIKTRIIFDGYKHNCLLFVTGADMILDIVRLHCLSPLAESLSTFLHC